jgi:hypothetical protein
MTFCHECKHCDKSQLIAYCLHPDNVRDEVTGQRVAARMARSPLYGFCGPEARGYEPAPVEAVITIVYQVWYRRLWSALKNLWRRK